MRARIVWQCMESGPTDRSGATWIDYTLEVSQAIEHAFNHQLLQVEVYRRDNAVWSVDLRRMLQVSTVRSTSRQVRRTWLADEDEQWQP